MPPSPASPAPRQFTLDIVFDTFASPRQLGYRFVTRESGLHFPDTWNSEPAKKQRVYLGEPGQEIYLRLGLWGRHLVPQGARLDFALRFRAAPDAPAGQAASPFDPRHAEITQALAAGVTLTDRDIFASHQTMSYWALDPRRFGLPVAKEAFEAHSVFDFYYFPQLSSGRYDFEAQLRIVPAPLDYDLDPEMEVGELDDPPP